MLRKFCGLLTLFVLGLTAPAQDSRHFTFHYAFTVKNLPAGKKVRIWIPASHSDAYQEVKVISAKGDLPLMRTRESRYGNEIYVAQTNSSTQPDLHFDVEYDVLRHERVALALAPPWSHRLGKILCPMKSGNRTSNPMRSSPLPACQRTLRPK